mgnify:CR=1 FL=1
MGENKMLYEIKNLQSRAGTGENQRGEKGRGGMARGGRKGCPSISPLRAGKTYTLLDAEGSGMVRRIWFTFPPNDPMAMRCIILRIYWDGQEQPSVEVPMGDFFGLPHGVNRDLQSEYIQVNAGTAYNCWIPMPFRKHARITVENDGEHDIAHLFYEVDYTLGDEIPEDAGYFHAQFRRQNPCPMHSDYTLLETTGKGVYLGTVLGVRSLYTESWWGEGEMKFYLDGDTDYPTICGTGTEDYFCGSYNFENPQTHQYQTFTTPYSGLCQVIRPDGVYASQTRFGLYRWHIADPVYFAEELRVTVQALGWRSGGRYLLLQDDMVSVAYFYLDRPACALPPLGSPDELEII